MNPGDFKTMIDAVSQLSEALKHVPNSQLSVIQFSGRTQVEVPLQAPGKLDCATMLKGMTRMNGGTNMAAALASAAAEMHCLHANVQRKILLMSDFRIDDYSAAEAVGAALDVSRAYSEMSFFAFGVGRMVDPKLVKDLLLCGSPPHSLDGYLWLGYSEDSPVEDY